MSLVEYNDIKKLIKLYFEQPKVLYQHLFGSYNQLVEEIIPFSLVKENNYFYENVDKNENYLHGFRCKNVRMKPVVFENNPNQIMFPNEARKNHLNYFATVYADVEQIVEKRDISTGEKTIKVVASSPENDPIAIANIPVMVKSKYCSTSVKKDLHGECKLDPGGYFIVNGQEKVVMSIEKMVDNKFLVFTKRDSSFPNGYFHVCQINSKSNDWSDNLQILTLKEKKDGTLTISTSQLSDIPIVIFFRALGLESDQDIISNCCYSLEDINMINLIKPSIDFPTDEEGNKIRTKEQAIEYLITKLRRNRRFSQTDEELAKVQKRIFLEKIFREDLLPHEGEDVPLKIRVLGKMINKVFNVMLGRKEPDDRDALTNKRIETPGVLIGQLFRQNWKKMLNEIGKHFKKKNQSDTNPVGVLNQIKPNVIEQGIKTALSTGIWGMNKTKKGVAQSLQRLSWFQAISLYRRVMAPSLDASTSGVTSIRHVNNLQFQFMCLTKDSTVLQNDRYTLKPINEMNESDKVISLQKDMSEEPTKIFNHFERMADDIKMIKTISGRTIKATEDHPFLVKRGEEYEWVPVRDIKTDDLVVIRNCDEYIEESGNDILLEIDDNHLINNYTKELSELGYIKDGKLCLDIKKQKIIARLIGSLNTDGNINCPKNKYYSASFNMGEEQDVYDANDDIIRLGFGSGNISRKVTKLVDKDSNRETIFKTWRLDKAGAFGSLITFLGGFSGNKTEYKKYVPSWIINSSDCVVREYLSSLQGGDGCRLSVQKNENNDKLYLGEFKQTCNELTIDTTMKYMNEISNLYNRFDIESSVHRKTKDESKYEISIRFSQVSDNLEKLVGKIGYRYCEEKRRMSSAPYELCKIRGFYKQLTVDKKNRIIKLHSQGKRPSEIEKITNYDSKFVSKIIRQINEDRVSNTRSISPISYKELIKNSLNNGCIAVPIYSIENCEPEMVYDFTTCSDNHNFIANSFVTHNCPVETPEGGKIGIIKNLSMTSTISIQNDSQDEVIKTVISMFDNTKHPVDVDPLEMEQWGKVYHNGSWVCVTKDIYGLYKLLKKKRQEGFIDKHTSIYLDFHNKEIGIYSEGGRLIRPILVVDNNKVNLSKEVLGEVNKQYLSKEKSKSWNILLEKFPNLFEYEDIESSNFLMIAETPYDLQMNQENMDRKIDLKNSNKVNRYGDYRFVNYTHCDIHPWLMLGIVSSSIPFSNHNYATRNIIFFSQAKQSIGVYLTSYKDRMDISQILYHPQVPLVTTDGMHINKTMDLPFGENTVVAIMSYMGYNQEDSVIFNESAIRRGLFRADTLKKEHSEIVKNPSTSQDDIFVKPDPNKVTGMKQGNYGKLNDKGFAPEETIISNQDVIIGKVSPIQPTGNNNKVYKDNSTQFKSNVDGVIDRVHTGVYNSDGYEMYNVRIRMEREPVIGDKFSNRHGQKGTLGILLPQKDMPFTEEGIIPDLIMNPHSIPSRMTVAQLVECVASKIAALTGEFIDGTPFNNYDVTQLPEILKKLGYQPYGTETMYCGITGKKMKGEIFIGPTYYVRLKHMVLDKVHSRSIGPRQALTRQPLEGRSRDGGLKIGEMEKDAMVAHGIGQFLKERMMETSDITKVYVCDECGRFASKVFDKDYYYCQGCNNSTRISAVSMPYACKLMFQEITSVNILPRIRTKQSVYESNV
jgi:DNA-directed RNA polymerase beta subunit/intein/homing endonuclease